jgi:hypothetical protein
MKQPTKFALEVRTTDFILRPTDDDGEVVEFATSVVRSGRSHCDQQTDIRC